MRYFLPACLWDWIEKENITLSREDYGNRINQRNFSMNHVSSFLRPTVVIFLIIEDGQSSMSLEPQSYCDIIVYKCSMCLLDNGY